jgi:hypothetical protein
VVDRIPGINLNINCESEISALLPAPASVSQNLNMNRYAQTNIRLFPGKWFNPLSAFSFEVGYRPELRGYIRNVNAHWGWTERLFRFDYGNRPDFFDKSDLFQLRGEWRPSASFSYNTGIELIRMDSKQSDSRSSGLTRRMNQRLEFHPTIHSVVTLQYTQIEEEKRGYSTTVWNNPMMWVENRWSEKFQSKFNLVLWREDKKTGKIQEYTSTFSPLLGLTYRLLSSGATRLEIRDDLFASFYRSKKTFSSLSTNNYSNSLMFDYYPISVLIIRLRASTTYRDQLDSDFDFLYHTLELRATIQL